MEGCFVKPFFCFFGGKYRAAPRYPPPVYDTIIEPFAGSAGYSVRYYDRNIILVEKNPKIVATWRYLINASPDQIMDLPLYDGTWATVEDLDIELDAKYLIGWWLNKGSSEPCKSPSAWMRSGMYPNYCWGEVIRNRIASQVGYIKHWEIIEGDYSSAPDIEASWFVDPPYEISGKRYRYGSKLIDYQKLADWCRGRPGQVIVCENEGANWLPFKAFTRSLATAGKKRTGFSDEAIWTNGLT
jgi:site-specific DNA-adenine methylase